MYAQSKLYSVPLGRRILEKRSRGRAQITPAIVPELVAWLRMIGNRYIELLTSLPSSRTSHSDSFLASMRQTTEFRISLIQDLINTLIDSFSYAEYLKAWDITRVEMDITEQDLDPSNYDNDPLHTDGEGI